MQFIEALKLRSKLLFLFTIIASGLVLVGIIGAININSMKQNIDSLYFGSLIPVVELNEILLTYHGTLVNTMYKAKNSNISSDEINADIENSITKIQRHWNSYESHFKRDEELQYVEYVASEIVVINNYFNKILLLNKKGKSLKNLSIKSLERYISHIHKTIKKLINYEVEIAEHERKNFLEVYNSATVNLGIMLLLIIITLLSISLFVFKSIQSDQTKLEITTKKLKRANKKLENASYTDSLTTLHNRRYFNYIYDKEIKRAKRTKNYITFMMLDIDYFKQYNDTYGHIEGDHALKSVANVLKNRLKRPGDFVFRLGGEEFGVLLTNTDESNSANLARDICESIKLREIEHKNSLVNKYLSISVGVVCCIADKALDEELLLSRADEMLYEAKNSGRDRYHITTDISRAKTQPIEDEKVSA